MVFRAEKTYKLWPNEKWRDCRVEEIKDLTDLEQAELIADEFSKVANEYEPLEADDIEIPSYSEEEIPQFEEKEIEQVLNELDTNKSNTILQVDRGNGQKYSSWKL